MTDGTVPNWLARLLRIDPAQDGQGTAWRLEEFWNWPPWVTLLFLLAAGGLIVLAYWFEIGRAKVWARMALAAIRITLIVMVLLMIAGWVLTLERTDLPYVIVLIDTSGSMQPIDRSDDRRHDDAIARRVLSANFETATRLNLAKTLLLERDARLLTRIASRYQLKLFFVGESARLVEGTPAELAETIRSAAATDTQTRLGGCVRQALDELRGNPVAAIILLSDGITTDDQSLSDVAGYCRRRGAPLFTIGLGREQPGRDLDLTDLLVNDVVFVDDVVNFQLRLVSQGFAGREVDVILRRGGSREELVRRRITVGQDGRPQTVRLPYRPTDVGEIEFTAEVQLQAEENKPENNVKSRRVSVRKQQIRVLLVQFDPSYEFRFLKHALERDTTIDLKTVLQDADPDYALLDQSAIKMIPADREELFQYDVILFGDVDPAFVSRSAQEMIRDFVKQNAGGIAFIAGPRFTPSAYRDTPLDELMPIDLSAVREADEADDFSTGFSLLPTDLGLSSPAMQIGDSSAGTADIWKNFPPLYWWLDAPKLKRGALVLAVHSTQKTARGQPLPLVSMQYVGAGKAIFHAIDSTYRWRAVDDGKYFVRYWVQTVRNLARSKLLGQDRRVELTTDRREYRRGVPVRLRVRFFAERDAPAADDAVAVVLERKGAADRTIRLRRDAAHRGLFLATVTQLADGAYRARVVHPAAEGPAPAASFRVTPPPGETQRLRMDLAELTSAAKISGGKFYRFDTAGRLLGDLPEGRQVPVKQLPTIPLWNRWPIAAVFLLLLIGEWVLRKRLGML